MIDKLVSAYAKRVESMTKDCKCASELSFRTQNVFDYCNDVTHVIDILYMYDVIDFYKLCEWENRAEEIRDFSVLQMAERVCK